jgi:hypothetical protein
MRILRRAVFSVAVVGAAGSLFAPVDIGAQVQGRTGSMHRMATMKTTTMSKAQKIANAVSAAPEAISGKAAVLDWPAKEGDAPAMLRDGSNGWTCLPDMPDTEGNDPACMDKPWMRWAEAYLTHKAPTTSSVGIGYMLAAGGGWGSNTDPYAMKATPDNQWHHAPPHLMILVPDLQTLQGISTDPTSGGPYVMFPGTPYAHIMAPMTSASMHMSMKMPATK